MSDFHLNEYGGAADWRWGAMDMAERDLKIGLEECDRLLGKFAGVHTAPGEHHARAVRKLVLSALRRLKGA